MPDPQPIQLHRNPVRSAAFRFAVLLATVFAVGSFTLLVAVREQVGHYAVEAARGRLKAEAAILAGEYDQLGRKGLVEAMLRHQAAGRDAQFHYLLQDARGGRLFGALPASAANVGWARIVASEEDGAKGTESAAMTAYGRRLPGGLLLVVATDNFDVDDMRWRIGLFTALSGLGITVFALVGGYWTGNLFLRRLNEVNRSVELIIRGERSERLPMIGIGPEFDELARNLNRMLDRNEAAMDALRQVSTDIAHDLRTPLTRLHHHLETMRDCGASPAMVDEALDQTDGLLSTFNALLRIGTVEGGMGRRLFQPVPLRELMDRVHQLYQPLAEDAGHRLIARHDADAVVDGDSELIAQMVINLIENAIVHTPPGTTVVTSLTREDGAAVIEVRDDGPGIPAAEHDKVFRRFYRLDASRNTQGAGLGLALVAAVAALHGAAQGIVPGERGFGVRVRFPLRPGEG